MTNGLRNADWKAVLQKFGEWKHSEYTGRDALLKAYKRPSDRKVCSWYRYLYELTDCRLINPGVQSYSVAGIVRKSGRKYFRTYIGSSNGVRMLEVKYALLRNCE